MTHHTGDHVAHLVREAADAAEGWARTTPSERSAALTSVADRLEEHRDELVKLADAETRLGSTRLNGELTRTVFQLRLFAEVAEAGEFYDVRIDRADQDWPTGPRPDLRRYRVPLGPTLVFAASNFPFAFSVAGGDTASALASGCPVVVKAHPGHPELSRRTAELVGAALGRPGVFALIEGHQAGVDALRSTEIKAAAFTGSVAGGLALAKIAAERPEPIPFFGELGSINPVVITPGAARARAAEIVTGYVASLTQGAGQFCTNPGLLFAPEGSDLLDLASAALREVAPAPMLNDRISTGFLETARRLGDRPGLTRLVWPEDTASLAPRLATTDLDTFASDPGAAEECFGPFGLVVTYARLTDVASVVRGLPGQLTTTVHAEDDEAGSLTDLVAACADRSGRVVWNGWPTGVSVTPAMQHGGPFPATTAPATTSVGTAAVERFLRPVSYQNWPPALLPEPLRDDNPWSVPQKVS
ncbi:aldehyde dehydrogenase (NADP(+)) [Saccharomonospora xinjiangensis]|uniref:aldehyde dehydrogenase (NADP(+)) n=1 Tax=Saccharomonospora xinjiangensis TaxID=75294 RepID=UPI0010C2C560|nr:aldehyde dehydrogenase (NADP(+)) [Saccharomonospora xinjiangensis]QBQ59652.1 NADP-dependent fatty aldehyde dehydrogenase [Saccharomonospora xinjiangensis]